MRQKHEALLKKRHAYRHKRYADSGPMRALQALLRRSVGVALVQRAMSLHRTVSP